MEIGRPSAKGRMPNTRFDWCGCFFCARFSSSSAFNFRALPCVCTCVCVCESHTLPQVTLHIVICHSSLVYCRTPFTERFLCVAIELNRMFSSERCHGNVRVHRPFSLWQCLTRRPFVSSAKWVNGSEPFVALDHSKMCLLTASTRSQTEVFTRKKINSRCQTLASFWQTASIECGQFKRPTHLNGLTLACHWQTMSERVHNARITLNYKCRTWQQCLPKNGAPDTDFQTMRRPSLRVYPSALYISSRGARQLNPMKVGGWRENANDSPSSFVCLAPLLLTRLNYFLLIQVPTDVASLAFYYRWYHQRTESSLWKVQACAVLPSKFSFKALTTQN